MLAAERLAGTPHAVLDATEPFTNKFMIWKVPAVLLALKPYTLNLSVLGAATANEVVQVAVMMESQVVVLFGDWLLPWSTQVVPPLMLYANLTDAGPVAERLSPTLNPVTFRV